MDQVDSLLKRPKAYNNIDGTGELGMGFLCLGYALLTCVQLHTPKDSIWNQMYVLFIWVGLMVAMIHFGTKAIKNHITYPRTGFVKYGTHGKIMPPIILMIIATCVAAVVSAGVAFAIRSHWSVTSTLPAVVGSFVAMGYALGITRTVPWKAVGWKWAVPASILLGSMAITALPPDRAAILAPNSLAVTGLRPESTGAILLCMILCGAIFFISGSVTFCTYLRHTKAPTEEANEPANADVQ